MSSDRDTGALLAAESYRRWPADPRTRVALMGAMTAAPGYLGRSYIPGAQRIAGDLIPGTRTAFLVRDGIRPAIVDSDTGAALADFEPLPAPTSARRAYTRVSQNGAIAVVAQATEELGLEVTTSDLRSRKQLGAYHTVESVSEFFSLSPDGGEAYFGERWSKELYVLDTGTGTMRVVTSGVPEAEYDEFRVSTAVVGDWVVMASMRTLRAIDPTTGRVARQLPIPYGSGSGDLVPVGDGTVLLAGGMALAMVDVAKEKVVWSVEYETYRPDLCEWLTVAPRRNRVYCADTAGPVIELSLRDGQPTGRSFDGQLGSTGDIRVLPGEDEMIVIGAETPSIARWRLDGGGAAATLVAPGRLVSDGFEPRGTLLMTERRPRRLTFGWSQETSTGVAGWDPYRRRSIHDFSVSNPTWIAPGVAKDTQREAAIRRDVRTGQTGPLEVDEGDFLTPSRISGVTYAVAGATVRRWNQQTGELHEPVMKVDGEFSSLTDTPDGRYVAIRYWVPEEDLNRLVVFDTGTGTEVARGLDRHTVPPSPPTSG
jgi:outer membrane protein assembly factor BamB